jgi:hypothetical protein
MQLVDEVKDLREANAKLRRICREQDEFIQSMRQMIADFVYGENAGRSLGRHLNGGR